MRFKIFKARTEKQLEEVVNLWLDENPDVRIVSSSQSQKETRMASETVLSVFYSKGDELSVVDAR